MILNRKGTFILNEKDKGKQSIFLTIFFKMAGEGLGIILLFPDIAASRRSKKTSLFFLEAILQHLKTGSITCQEGCAEK